MIQAKGKVEVDQLKTETDLARTKMRLETWRVQQLADAESKAAAEKMKADLEEEAAVIAASWQEEKMIMDAEVTKYEADAEQEAIKGMASKREHDYLLREKQILRDLATKGEFNLIGTPGDRLVGAMLK